MTEQENKIPIKGYTTFHPLKHCMIGRGFNAEYLKDFFPDPKILDPMKRIADETEEDFLTLVDIMEKAGVKTYRPNLDMEKYSSPEKIYRPPITPRDHFGVIGEKLYAVNYAQGYADVLKKVRRENLIIRPFDKKYNAPIDTNRLLRAGKDLFWGLDPTAGDPSEYIKMFEQDGFRVHLLERDYHTDAVLSLLKPRVAVSLQNIENYTETMPGWEVLLIDDNPTLPFADTRFKDIIKGRWWIDGEEDNETLVHFIDKWLSEWVGYVNESVFDVNMTSIDENTVIVNNYNKKVFDFLAKHKIEPIIFNFRHRYFYDGGVNCITQDFYREGTMEDYFG